MLLYSPELDTFLIFSLAKIDFEIEPCRLSYDIEWCFGNQDPSGDMLNQYAWYFIGAL